MKWFDDIKRYFYEYPKTTDQPAVLPASWIAACILYHLRTLQFNVMPYSDYCRKDAKVPITRCGLYPTFSLINHSPEPHSYLIDLANDGAFVYASHPLKAGEELSVSYVPEWSDVKIQGSSPCTESNRKKLDKLHNGCALIKCPGCEHLSPETKRRCPYCKDRSLGCLQDILVRETEALLDNYTQLSVIKQEDLFQASALIEQLYFFFRPPNEFLSKVDRKFFTVVQLAHSLKSSSKNNH